MQEERLKNMEGYMEQLIRMVADNNKIVSEMRQDFKDEKQVNQQRYEEFKDEKQLNQHRHEILLTELKKQNADTDYLRDLVSK
ncbi:hypothetical protein HUG15_03540 [Salicibibacter cibarius]|uniref:Uncharacterized protein n=1 Tax=Salicibibacter cibarius TaxID=2743000 RepID=A0A7T6Z0M6_9BACI|nr:hypothetical protein [Salicibibacter cibarius]QQK74770.1 hypothetical protein HUG15_03540 [Salicibibacter cibarius]